MSTILNDSPNELRVVRYLISNELENYGMNSAEDKQIETMSRPIGLFHKLKPKDRVLKTKLNTKSEIKFRSQVLQQMSSSYTITPLFTTGGTATNFFL